MDETLHQLGELLLRSVPTIVLMGLVYLLYAVIVHRPLRRVLQERHTRTEGAVEKSRADIAAAEARTSEYEQRVREARAAVFRAQEARRQSAMQARTEAVERARQQAKARVETAKQEIEKNRSEAETGLYAEASSLAQEIVKRVLRPVAVEQ